MLKEAIQEIEQLTKQSAALDVTRMIDSTYDGDTAAYLFEVVPTQFGQKLGSAVKPFRPERLDVATLTGFVDAIAAGVAGTAQERIVHVEDYLTVSLKSTMSDTFGVRDTLITAKHKPIDAFTFDYYYNNPAKFIIGLQVSFLQTEELLYLIKVASNLKAGKSIHVKDDGFSQAITLKVGEVSTAEVDIKPRIKLVPIRTFSEAAPVESEFLIRFQQSQEETPQIALFNVDGTKWQGETMRSIKNYLTGVLPANTTIIA